MSDPWKPTSKRQQTQRRNWQALGTVKGFNGYLINLEHVIKHSGVSAIDKHFLNQDIAILRNRLAILEKALQRSNRHLKEITNA